MNELQLLNVLFGIGASLATIGGFVAKKGKAGSLAWLSDRFGVDLAELVIPGSPPEDGMYNTEEANERRRFLLEYFPPEELGEALRHHTSRNLDADYTTTDLVELSCSQMAPGAVVEIALDGEGGHPRKRILGEHLTDDELKSLLDGRDIWPDPINQIAQLDDNPERAYAWILSDDSTAEDRMSLSQEIERTFIEMKHSEPESMHFVVSSIDEIAELDSETVSQYVKPWLNAEEN